MTSTDTSALTGADTALTEVTQRLEKTLQKLLLELQWRNECESPNYTLVEPEASHNPKEVSYGQEVAIK